MSNKIDVVSVRLVKDGSLLSDKPINNPEDVIRSLGEYLMDFNKEVMCLINLDGKRRTINCSFVCVGTSRSCLVPVDEIIRTSILSGASYCMIAHNHPSGNLMPSKEDIRVTNKLVQAFRLVDLRIVDHVIIGGDNTSYFSFFQRGVVDFCNEPSYSSDITDVDFSASLVSEPGSVFQSENTMDGIANDQHEMEAAVRRHRGR